MLEKLESKKKSVHVVEQLVDAIDRGVYKVGDRLPSEEALAEQTGVSRPSVREALGALRLVGILETRMGDGTYVKSTGGNKASRLSVEPQILSTLEEEKGNPFEALEARRVLETNLIPYAAERRTSEDLQELEAALKRIIASIKTKDYGGLLEADRDFHLAIGKAAKNSLLEQMLTFLLDVMKQGLWPRMKKELLAASKRHMEETRRSHQGIYEAIKERNNEKAVEIMEQHFDEIERLYQYA
ncbi:MAG: FCD domain-containing protein [Nitrospiraceae bacterium]|nr:FCD domain-containing protein [Nitrospiraceae bacterium]